VRSAAPDGLPDNRRRHPDAQGHGNRDTGTPGYKASVNYVANLMRRGRLYRHIQTYSFRTPQVVGVPTLILAGRDYPVEKGLGDGKAIQRRKRHRPRSAGDWLSHGLLRRRVCEFSPRRYRHVAARRMRLRRAGCECGIRRRIRDHSIRPTVPTSSARARKTARSRAAGCNAPSASPGKDSVVAVTSPQWRRPSRADRRRRVSTAHLKIRTQIQSGADYNVI